jgi:hypothetical protein
MYQHQQLMTAADSALNATLTSRPSARHAAAAAAAGWPAGTGHRH